MQTYTNYSFAICWRLSAFKSPSHEKSIFLKIRSFFSFKFFQGHNWLTNYPDSEFHGHWKTVTLSSISPNLSKHRRFLAFWLSLCFGSFLLFLVCHDTAFLFSTHAKAALGPAAKGWWWWWKKTKLGYIFSRNVQFRSKMWKIMFYLLINIAPFLWQCFSMWSLLLNYYYWKRY